MKRLIYIALTIFALSACDKDVHDEPKPGSSFVSVALAWEDRLNSTEDIENVNIWIYDKTGALVVDKEYPSAAELASHSYEIAAGQITVVVGMNVEEQLEANHKATPEGLKFELARQCVLYEMTFYGDKTLAVSDGAKTVVVLGLHDKPHDDTFIDTDPDVNDWQHNGDHTNEDIFKPREP